MRPLEHYCTDCPTFASVLENEAGCFDGAYAGHAGAYDVHFTNDWAGTTQFFDSTTGLLLAVHVFGDLDRMFRCDEWWYGEEIETTAIECYYCGPMEPPCSQ